MDTIMSTIIGKKYNIINGNVKIIKKEVRFYNIVSVILINHLSEYGYYLKSILWYTDNDYEQFKKELIQHYNDNTSIVQG